MDLPAFGYTAKAYSLLTKPGIIFGNIVTTAGGFALASRSFAVPTFLATLFGMVCIIGSACVVNNYIDRNVDKKMKRTQDRALATGSISVMGALIFGALLFFIGTLSLLYWVSFLATLMALLGFFLYVGLYSFSKYHSVHGTLMGSVAGALPPVVGYVAGSHQCDLGAFLIFAIVMMWQMPHFFAIAIYRLRDYQAAHIPVLPAVKGVRRTKIEILLYMVGFAIAALLPFFFHKVGILYLIVNLVLSVLWLSIAIRGFFTDNDIRWAREVFLFSLIVIMGLCLSLILRL